MAISSATKPTNLRIPSIFFPGFIGVSVIAWSLPWIGLIVTAFRPFSQAASTGWWTVFTTRTFTLQNFATALKANGLWRAAMNSFIITIPTVLLVLVVSSLAAYALTWTRMPGKKALYAIFAGLLVVPPEITLVPTLKVFRALGLSDSFPGIWLSHVSAALAFGIFLLGNFFAQVPRDLVESARIDGTGEFGLLRRVILPLSGTALASLATFDFLWVWNDLIRSLVIISDPTKQPLTAVVANMSGTYGANITVQAAGAVLLLIPPLIVFMLAQKAFIRGVLTGAVK